MIYLGNNVVYVNITSCVTIIYIIVRACVNECVRVCARLCVSECVRAGVRACVTTETVSDQLYHQRKVPLKR